MKSRPRFKVLAKSHQMFSENSTLLLSIHPKYADAILSGAKRVELRRRRPRINAGPALIYASSPRMHLIASFWVESIVRAPLRMLWQLVRDAAGVTRAEFNAYFKGLESGVAIRISNVVPLHEPIPLDELRAIWPGFHPPQGFRYLTADEIHRLPTGDIRQTA
jgi:predicted transcriptional regulator